MVKNEIANLEMVESDGVIRLFKTFKTSTHFYIMTELCNGGDVSELLEARGGKLTEVEARILLSKIAIGLADMHDAGVMHRDMKLPNILLNFPSGIKLTSGQTVNQDKLINFSKEEKNDFLSKVDLTKTAFEVKIADFGFSKYVINRDLPNMTMCGTPLYMSPQIVQEDEYSMKTDIWSFGAIFFEMLTGNTPFQSKSMKQLDKDMAKGTYQLLMDSCPSLEALHLLSSCLITEEDSRLSADDLRYHPFTDLSVQVNSLAENRRQINS